MNNLSVAECLEKTRLNDFNSRKGIKHLLGIPSNINLKYLQKDIIDCYSYFYIAKPRKIENETKEQRIERYLNPNIELDIFDNRPQDYTRDKYRMLINIKENWLKKVLKKVNKLLSSSLINKEKKDIFYNVPYLHSSVKKRSYETNAKEHRNNNYILAIDIRNFYPSIKKEKLYRFFRKNLNLEKDIASIYSIICTCPLDDPNAVKDYELGLGQGLATSPILAFLVNYPMFDYIYKKAQEENIIMTVYVDDVVFSSNNEISQKFINSLFGIIKSYGLSIKRDKLKKYNPTSSKKITGVYITKTKQVKVSNAKHEETAVQYNYLVDNMIKCKNLDTYFQLYNLFIKFKGNVQFISLIEEKINCKYSQFIEEYKNFFLNGIKKKKKNIGYKKDNISDDDYKKIIAKYEKYLKYISSKASN